METAFGVNMSLLLTLNLETAGPRLLGQPDHVLEAGNPLKVYEILAEGWQDL